LRAYFLSCNIVILRCCHIRSFVFFMRVLTIILAKLFMKTLNWVSFVESLHCVFLAILRSQRVRKACLISATSSSWFSWRNKDNVSSLTLAE
jgi:hypothetical protein